MAARSPTPEGLEADERPFLRSKPDHRPLLVENLRDTAMEKHQLSTGSSMSTDTEAAEPSQPMRIPGSSPCLTAATPFGQAHCPASPAHTSSVPLMKPTGDVMGLDLSSEDDDDVEDSDQFDVMGEDEDMEEPDNLLDSDDDDDDDDDEDDAAGLQRDRVPLQQFLRLFQGGVARGRASATSNDELITNLKQTGVLSNEKVAEAMRACPRKAFLPGNYQREAYIDAPVRLEEQGFNVSAPHMHAVCLEALDLKPGLRVLDIGSGCGIITCAAAYLVGATGSAVGIDIKASAITLARKSVGRMINDTNLAWPSTPQGPARMMFERHNAFMPSRRHQGKYDRVHAGASCHPDRLQVLLDLLKPEGGILVTPVTPADMRVFTKTPEGVSSKLLSQVRYSDLEVPSDAEIMVAQLHLERKQRIHVPAPSSSFADDIQTIHGEGASSADSNASSSSAIDAARFHKSMKRSSSDGIRHCKRTSSSDGSRASKWGGYLKTFMSCSGGGKNVMEAGLTGGQRMIKQRPTIDLAQLGAPDAALTGSSFSLPVHSAVMRARCEAFRARCESGMRDAEASNIPVPEQFSQEALRAFVNYVYQDWLDARIGPDMAVEVVHVAQYFGCPRLSALCEVILVKGLKAGDPQDPDVVEASVSCLALADEAALPHLKAVALDFILSNHAAVMACSAYSTLNRQQLHLIASQACAQHARMTDLVMQLAAQSRAKPPESP
ncbi:hypothetical protein WJX74_003052 [Apatococcus lobatus]|uniref:protein-L-isoaspartate(D-aspartate) O-methyltransferase n=2 Tax=Apatococcus TaxID=904362 RepID=A0AAW1SGU1_9CHLO